MTILRAGISCAFFRFYFDSQDPERRLLVLRTSFWFTMAIATLGLVAGSSLADPIADAARRSTDPWLVRAAFVGIWAQMNYGQLTAVFRVEERSVAFVLASLSNIVLTVGATLLLVVVLRPGRARRDRRQLHRARCWSTSCSSGTGATNSGSVLRPLLREMNRFGLPLVPAALALIATNFSDRFFLKHFDGLEKWALRDRRPDLVRDGAR